MHSNDNFGTPGNSTVEEKCFDAHGKAALLLVESLVHGLCEKSALSTIEAVEITQRASSVQYDRAIETKTGCESAWRSFELLAAIASSLEVDIPVDPDV
ncbi:hypothetical protein GCM10010833_09440 [Blastomonas aquatica]|uniref:Addiction module antidote protein n=1 Tax=Blastomonas aquatica TaxID=1510276 RepID=A0ABQ1J1V7_9SPHN|nr:hypothetical protein GCM10010833_09440 [Blastomonas aquatica]